MQQEMTDIEFYDRAVYIYLLSVSRKVTYATTENARKSITRDSKYEDNIPYEFISYHRSPDFEIDLSRYNFTAATAGDYVRLREVDREKGLREARYIKHLPVNLTYQVDLWAAKETSVQKMAIDLISKIYMKDQVLEVPVLPDGELARFHILEVNWTDNSDLEEAERGKVYRHTITFTIDARIKLVQDKLTTKFQCCKEMDIVLYED